MTLLPSFTKRGIFCFVFLREFRFPFGQMRFEPGFLFLHALVQGRALSGQLLALASEIGVLERLLSRNRFSKV